jgi:exonuclease SbcC
MIASLKLQDFQSHEKLALKFGPGVNCIVGPTDVGKSAVIRALGWVLLNNLSGDGFIRRGAETAKASVRLDDGTLVVRSRGKGGNTYQMGEGSTKEAYVSFGAGVPDEVRGALRVSELNFQGQHDAPFWFSESPSEVSRRLNAIVDLGLIDDALSEVAGKLRQARSTTQVLEASVGKAKERAEELAFVSTMDADLQVLEQAEKELERIRTDAQTLEEGIDRAREAARVRKVATTALAELEPALAAAKGMVDAQLRHEQAGSRADKLEAMLNRYASFRAVVKRGVPDVAPMEEALARARTASKTHSALSNSLNRFVQYRGDVVEAEKRLRTATAELDSLAGGPCPYCSGTGKICGHV